MSKPKGPSGDGGQPNHSSSGFDGITDEDLEKRLQRMNVHRKPGPQARGKPIVPADQGARAPVGQPSPSPSVPAPAASPAMPPSSPSPALPSDEELADRLKRLVPAPAPAATSSISNQELEERFSKLTGSTFSFEKKPSVALLMDEDVTEDEEIARLLEAVQDEADLDSMGIAPSQSFKGTAILNDPPKLSEEEEVRLLMESVAREKDQPPKQSKDDLLNERVAKLAGGLPAVDFEAAHRELLRQRRMNQPIEYGVPSPPTLDEFTKAPGRAPQRGGHANDQGNEQQERWCCICVEDAVLMCVDCDGDLYCKRCWKEGHPSSDSEYSRHRVRGLK